MWNVSEVGGDFIFADRGDSSVTLFQFNITAITYIYYKAIIIIYYRFSYNFMF